MRETLEYWKRAAAFAWKSTSLAPLPKFVQTVLTTVCTYAAQWRLGIRRGRETVTLVFTIIGSYLIVCLGSFLFNLLKAPSLMERERQEKHDAEAKTSAEREAAHCKEIEQLKSGKKLSPAEERVESASTNFESLPPWARRILRQLASVKPVMVENEALSFVSANQAGVNGRPLAAINNLTGGWLDVESGGMYSISPTIRADLKTVLGL
jgi:hypothetical protein